MDDTGLNLKEISKQLKLINSKINFLQDVMQETKNELELIKKTRIQNDNISQLAIIAEDNHLKFLKNRPKDCNALDFCTTFVEKGILRVLRTVLEDGEDVAINQINKPRNFKIPFSNNYMF